MSQNINPTFMKAVEEHERNWGNKTYAKRPSLMDIMSAPVVVFWESPDGKDPETITLHQSLAEIEKYFVRLLVARSKETIASSKRVSQVFQNQEKMVIKGVKILFKKVNE